MYVCQKLKTEMITQYCNYDKMYQSFIRNVH